MSGSNQVSGYPLTDLESHCVRCISALPEDQRETLADRLAVWAERGLPDPPNESPDEERLLAHFQALDPQRRHYALLTLAAALLGGMTIVEAAAVAATGSTTPAIEDAVRRTMPAIPGTTSGDEGFAQAMRDHMAPTLCQWAFSDVLGSSDRDAANVQQWADAFDECSQRLSPSFMAPEYGGESGPNTTKEAIEDFLADWRIAMRSDLTACHSAERLAGDELP